MFSTVILTGCTTSTLFCIFFSFSTFSFNFKHSPAPFFFYNDVITTSTASCNGVALTSKIATPKSPFDILISTLSSPFCSFFFSLFVPYFRSHLGKSLYLFFFPAGGCFVVFNWRYCWWLGHVLVWNVSCPLLPQLEHTFICFVLLFVDDCCVSSCSWSTATPASYVPFFSARLIRSSSNCFLVFASFCVIYCSTLFDSF